jgi:hypothetical protein
MSSNWLVLTGMMRDLAVGERWRVCNFALFPCRDLWAFVYDDRAQVGCLLRGQTTMMKRTVFLLFLLIPFVLGTAATVVFAPPIPPAHNKPDDVPDYLRGHPSDLYERVGDRIVRAPAELLKLAQTYPSLAAVGKGKTHKGRRITILSEKRRYKVGERVRILHVLEAVGRGLTVYEMGPKPVYDEYIDNKNRCPKPRDVGGIYDGRVASSPAVDFHYDITTYTFAKPGKHTIQWNGGGDPSEGDLGLQSNILTIEVVK